MHNNKKKKNLKMKRRGYKFLNTILGTDLVKVKLWIWSFGESINMDHWQGKLSILGFISEYSPECIC